MIVIFDHLILVSMYFNIVNDDKSTRQIEDDLNSMQQILNKYNNNKVMILCDSNARHDLYYKYWSF